MAGYTIPLTVTRQRISPLVRPRRDVAIAAGDDVILSVTFYEHDTSAAPLNLGGGTATLSIMPDGGGEALASVVATVASTAAGLLNVEIPASATQALAGRHAFAIQFEFASGISTVVAGTLNIEASSLPAQAEPDTEPGIDPADLPTTAPLVAGRYWNNGGVVTVS